MSRRHKGLEALRWELAGPPGPHLDDEQLAEIASAEAAGMHVNLLFEDEMAHLESCASCAEAYYELIEMMLDAVAGMAEMARRISPADVYAALLRPYLAREMPPGIEAQALAANIATALPSYFTQAPRREEDVSDALLADVLARALPSPDTPAPLSAALATGVRQQLSALALFLQGMADIAWGSALDVVEQADARGQTMQLKPALRLAEEKERVYGDRPAPTNVVWPLLQQSAERRSPVPVQAQATRLSALACEVAVKVGEPGLENVAGRAVQVDYKGGRVAGQTDASGLVRLGPVPVAAVATMTIRVAA